MKRVFICLMCGVLMACALCLTGCGSEEAAKEDAHAGHNHGEEETPTTEGDAHAGHNHGEAAPTDAPDTNKHNHKEAAAMRLDYKTAKDGTLTLIIKDCDGKVICEEKGLAKTAVPSQMGNGVVELAWVLNNDPGGYQCLYINRLTCQVSDMIVGEQATDGNRIVYTEVKNGKLNVIVRDLFNKTGYNKTTTIDDAYTDGKYAVLRVQLQKNDQANVAYLTNKDGGHRFHSFTLYEKGEKKPETTKQTETTKK